MIAPSLKRTALGSTHPLFFHAAQVKQGGAVLSTAHNTGKASDWAEGHAETRACRAAATKGRSLKGAVVVSIRVTRTGRLANARPCAQCIVNMRACGVRKVVYSTASEALEEMRL